MRSNLCVSVLALLLIVTSSSRAEPPTKLSLNQGDRIVYIGNTLAERMQYFPHFETLLHAYHPDKELIVRNLGWSADELTLRPRSKDFQDHGHTLHDHKPDVILAFFGFNESFKGEEGLEEFKKNLTDFIKTTTSTKYNGKSAPRLVLFTPIAYEKKQSPEHLDVEKGNARIKLYAEAMQEVGAKHDVMVVNLGGPSRKLYATSDKPLTINGVHLNDLGYEKLAQAMIAGLFGEEAKVDQTKRDKLYEAVAEKCLQFFYDHRAVNGYYIYGGRKKPFGVVNFPREFEKLRKMIAVRDRRIHDIAQGRKVPDRIDDSDTGNLPDIPTNFKQPITITPPEQAAKTFTLPEGYEIQLFASEKDFPDLENPVAFAFDDKNRLFVATMASYPMYLPGVPVNDKILIIEDTDGDGKADKSKVFADGLHIPTGLAIGDGGVYVAQQPNLMFLKDTDGDDKADVRKLLLHGFDTADSHHSISAFTWGPGGALCFQEGTFHHTQIETPWGPTRLKDAGIFRYEPKTEKVDAFVSYGFANPWGHIFDKWGQNFVADASGGANYYGTAFSGDVDYPHKHKQLKQFLKKQWRPTCGCEIVSSRHFPEEVQGNYLLNNCIGFLGILQYKMKEDGSGFSATPVEPLLRSSDPNFRPVDLQFAPDGTLYVCDWFNPLIGHMQHSLRDPNRDKKHGRIWRIVYTGNKPLEPAKIAGASIAELLDLLKEYEDRTRYRARRALREHPTEKVMAEVGKWTEGLEEDDKNHQHHLLEALWVHQHHDVVNEDLLKKMLTSPDYRARAAATRVLCYWRDRVREPLKLLEQQVNDKHPRVRLEAVRALSFFKGEDAKKAKELAELSVIYPQDDYLKYTLDETLSTLNRRIK